MMARPQTSRCKVKSGCRTCKRRKVKCDEEWPVCRRCQSTGRKCDGYGVWGGGSSIVLEQQIALRRNKPTPADEHQLRAVDVVVRSNRIQSVPILTCQVDERQCFEWFIQRSAVKLSGVFYSDQWTKLLVQASVTEPAVRHAMLALSSAHQEEVLDIRSQADHQHNRQIIFTVKQYSQAIGHLQPHFHDGGRTSLRVTLFSCALFVWTEFLRGNYESGILHLKYGLNLLCGVADCLDALDAVSMFVDGWLITLFTRHLVQAKLAGQLLGFLSYKLPGSHIELKGDRFKSIHHARRGLENIILAAFDLQEQSRALLTLRNPEDGSENGTLSYEQKLLSNALHKWHIMRQATADALPPEVKFLERFAYRLLQLYYFLAYILVETCIYQGNVNDEIKYDRYESYFEKIVSHCIETYRIVYPGGRRNKRSHFDPEPTSPNSTSDIGWIPPLYWTAIKCRNRYLRHRAIEFVQLSPHKEGIWSTNLAVAIARKVVQIEEGSLYEHLPQWPSSVSPPTLDLATEDIASSPVLSPTYRLSRLEIMLPSDSAGKLLLKYCRGQEQGSSGWLIEEYDLSQRHWTEHSPPMSWKSFTHHDTEGEIPGR